jgi:hypothetical protein
MPNHTSRLARGCAALIALVALAALILQTPVLMELGDTSLAATLWEMPRYFTNLTNALVVLTLGSLALGRGPVRPVWLAALTASVVLVGAVYHLLLADLWNPQGLHFWTDQALHSAVPLGLGVWWLAYAPKSNLSLRGLPAFAIWPAIYTVYVLIRGALDGIYPYPFLNPVELGIGQVALNLFGLLLAILATGAVMIGIAKATRR